MNKNCKEFMVMDNSNIHYYDCDGNQQFDKGKKGEIINIDFTKPFSSNLSGVINNFKSSKFTFWDYLVENPLFFGALGMGILMLTVAILESSTVMVLFFSGVILILIGGSLISWNKKR